MLTCRPFYLKSSQILLARTCLRSLTSSARLAKKNNNQLPPRPTVAEDELKFHSLKGSGPGGQKIVGPRLSV